MSNWAHDAGPGCTSTAPHWAVHSEPALPRSAQLESVGGFTTVRPPSLGLTSRLMGSGLHAAQLWGCCHGRACKLPSRSQYRYSARLPPRHTPTPPHQRRPAAATSCQDASAPSPGLPGNHLHPGAFVPACCSQLPSKHAPATHACRHPCQQQQLLHFSRECQGQHLRGCMALPSSAENRQPGAHQPSAGCPAMSPTLQVWLPLWKLYASGPCLHYTAARVRGVCVFSRNWSPDKQHGSSHCGHPGSAPRIH